MCSFLYLLGEFFMLCGANDGPVDETGAGDKEKKYPGTFGEGLSKMDCNGNKCVVERALANVMTLGTVGLAFDSVKNLAKLAAAAVTGNGDDAKEARKDLAIDAGLALAGKGLGKVATLLRSMGGGGQKLLAAGWSFKAGQLDEHFAKHAAEWGVGNITKSGYLKRAQSLLSKKPGGKILGHKRSNGDILRYNTKTNEFAVGSANGTIRTLFRPARGMEYWSKQVAP